MKARRLLSALMLLQGHGRLSSRALAERLEVSERTAHRDMESLCEAGVPLVAHRGAMGGWELAKDWRTRVPGLDENELRALLMAQPAALSAPGLKHAAESAWQKLLAAMPVTMQAQASSMLARLHIDPTGWRHVVEGVPMLGVVEDAVARDMQLRFVYTRPGEEPSPRTVDPLGIVWKQTVWYLVARTERGMRTYRVSRMKDAEVLASGFVRPTFDLAEYWRASSGALDAQLKSYRVRMALAPQAVPFVSGWVQVVPEKTDTQLPPGWCVCTIRFDHREQAKFVCLGLGDHAKVLEPEELRMEVMAEAGRVAARDPLV